MINYKKHIFEVYGLSEMPNRVENLNWTLDDGILNKRDAERILKNGKNVGIFKISEMSYRLYLEVDGNAKCYYLIDINHPFINAEFSYYEISTPIQGIESVGIWNWKYNKGLVRYFVEEYILKKYKTMVSDKLQTDRGFKFWQNLFDDLVESKKSHKMYAIEFKSGNVIKNIINKDEMTEFFGDNNGKYRFVIDL